MPLFGRQVVGTHSKARKGLGNHRGQGFSFRDVSGSPGLHHRGGRNGSEGARPAWCVSASDFGETNPSNGSNCSGDQYNLLSLVSLASSCVEAGLIESASRGVAGLQGFTMHGACHTVRASVHSGVHRC